MMRTTTIAIAALLATASHVHAGGFAVAEQSTTASGTAGAGTARTDDASAAWYNPAALADGGGMRFGLGMMAARPALTARAMDGSWETDNESAWVTPPHLNISFAEGAFAAGVAAGVPYGSGVTWPIDWPGRFEIVRSKLEVFRASPFVAYSFGKLKVSAGMHVDRTRMRVGRQLDFIDVEGDVFIDMDGTGWGVDAAAFYSATDDLDVGVTYKSRTSVSLSGGADFDSPDAFSLKTTDQNAGTELTIPDRLAVGAAYRAGTVTVIGDVEMTMWGVYDEIVIDFEMDATPNAVQVNNWKNTMALRAGAEWRPAAGWVARGGAFYDPSPAQDDTLAPSSPDSSRVGLTIGATKAVSKAWHVDAFAERMQLLGRTSANENALAAEYGGHAHMVGFGLRYQPGADDADDDWE